MKHATKGNVKSTIEKAETRLVAPEVVAQRAFELWMSRGCPIGSPEVDWFEAEAELEEESSRIGGRPLKSHVA